MTHCPGGPFYLIGTISMILWLSACVDGSTSIAPPQTPEDQQDVFERLASLRYASISEAFSQLSALRYELTRATEERDAVSGQVAARSVEVFDVGPDGTEVIRMDSVEKAAFSDGFLSFLAGRDTIPGAVGVSGLFPDRPPFADLKTREQFSYAALADSSIAGEAADIFEVRALVSPDRQSIQRVRLAIARSDSSLLYYTVYRIERSIFYDEVSEATVELNRDPGGELLPRRKHVDLRVDVPMDPPRRFVLDESYAYRRDDSVTLP